MTDLARPTRREPLRADRGRAPVVCPNCSEPTQLVAVRKVADEFCLACDHPLFWIPDFVTPDDHGHDGFADDHALRRRPGTAGRRRLAGRPCPECAEPNDVKAVYCLRCGSPMDPPPPPVEAETAPAPVPVFVPEPRKPLPYALLAALAIATLVLLIAVVAVITR